MVLPLHGIAASSACIDSFCTSAYLLCPINKPFFDGMHTTVHVVVPAQTLAWGRIVSREAVVMAAL